MPRRRWHEDYAEDVASIKAGGMSVVEIAERFGWSDNTVRKALDFAHRTSRRGGDTSNANGDAGSVSDRDGAAFETD
jgi:transposase-like protein